MVQFSSSFVSDSVWPHGLHAARQASLSITNSWSLLKLMPHEMPSNHLTLCCPLLLLPSIFPSIGVFQLSQFFVSGVQSIGVSASASVLPMNIQDWSILWWTGWSCSSRDSQESSPVPQFIHIKSLVFSFLYSPTLTSIHDYWKNHTCSRWTFVDKVMSLHFIFFINWRLITLQYCSDFCHTLSLHFNMLSGLVIAFLPSSKHLLISCLQSPSAVILEPKKIKSTIVSIVSPSIRSDRTSAMILVFKCWVLCQLFHSTLSLSSRGSLVPLYFLP